MRRLSQLSMLAMLVTMSWLLLGGVLRVADLTPNCLPLLPGCGIATGDQPLAAAAAVLGHGGLGLLGLGLLLSLALLARRDGPGSSAAYPWLVALTALGGERLLALGVLAGDVPSVLVRVVSPVLALVAVAGVLFGIWRLRAPVSPASTPVARGWWTGGADPTVRWLTRLVAGALLAVAGSGAVLGMDNAALPCTSWPLCANGEWPPADLSLASWLHMGHRVIAAVAALLVGLLLAHVWTHRASASIRQATLALAGLMVVQVLLGGDFVIARAPVWLGVLHVIAALALWIVCIRLLWLTGLDPVAAGAAWTAQGPVDGDGTRPPRVSGVPVLAGGQAAAALSLPAPDVALASPDWAALRRLVGDYVALTKPGILSLLLFTTFAAMLIAAAGLPSFGLICVTLLGGALAAGGANVLNCYIDRDIDAQMSRTRHRATAANRIPPSYVLVFGIALTSAAVLLLGLATNWLAAGLALAGNAFYVFVYTLWLKRRTPQNIVIGGAAGAVPPLVGWAAVTGNLSPVPWLLFAVIFMWTPPHFWSLALLKQGEYGRALVPMLPVVAGEAATRRQILLYSGLLFAVCLALGPAGLGPIYLAATVAVNAVFLGGAVLLYARPSKRHARQLFFFSLWYLVLIFGAGVVDRLILG